MSGVLRMAARFSRFDYGEFAVQSMNLSVLETHLPLPGDYRTHAEIE
ncbi:MAG: hypothetical protein M3373_01800 [Gemmatimonadota bacterium]|nr:hypothetical protein [Gemmatimonadota bacterium]